MRCLRAEGVGQVPHLHLRSWRGRCSSILIITILCMHPLLSRRA